MASKLGTRRRRFGSTTGADPADDFLHCRGFDLQISDHSRDSIGVLRFWRLVTISVTVFAAGLFASCRHLGSLGFRMLHFRLCKLCISPML